MKQLNKIFVLPLLFGLYSCRTSNKYLGGTYLFKENFEVHALLKLEKNGSYIYEWQNGLIFGVDSGSWIKRHCKIYLTSKLSNESIHVEETKNVSADSIVMRVSSTVDVPLSHSSILINGNTLLETDDSGIVSFKSRSDIESIKIKFLDYPFSPVYQVRDKSANVFLIKLDYLAIPYISFLNKPLRIESKNHISWTDKKMLPHIGKLTDNTSD